MVLNQERLRVVTAKGGGYWLLLGGCRGRCQTSHSEQERPSPQGRGSESSLGLEVAHWVWKVSKNEAEDGSSPGLGDRWVMESLTRISYQVEKVLMTKKSLTAVRIRICHQVSWVFRALEILEL